MYMVDSYVCDLTNTYVSNVPLMRVTWIMHMCDETQACVYHDSFICLP